MIRFRDWNLQIGDKVADAGDPSKLWWIVVGIGTERFALMNAAPIHRDLDCAGAICLMEMEMNTRGFAKVRKEHSYE